MECRWIRMTHARCLIPAAPVEKRQRRSRRNHMQPAVGVEHVGQGEQVVLIGAPAVMQHEQAACGIRRGPLLEHQRWPAHGAASYMGLATYTWRVPSVGPILRKFPVARVMALAELLLIARQHFMKLEPQERHRLVFLVRRGRGRPSNLTERERRELARLVQKAEPREFANTAMKRLVGIPVPGSKKSRDPS